MSVGNSEAALSAPQFLFASREIGGAGAALRSMTLGWIGECFRRNPIATLGLFWAVSRAAKLMRKEFDGIETSDQAWAVAEGLVDRPAWQAVRRSMEASFVRLVEAGLSPPDRVLISEVGGVTDANVSKLDYAELLHATVEFPEPPASPPPAVRTALTAQKTLAVFLQAVSVFANLRPRPSAATALVKAIGEAADALIAYYRALPGGQGVAVPRGLVVPEPLDLEHEQEHWDQLLRRASG